MRSEEAECRGHSGDIGATREIEDSLGHRKDPESDAQLLDGKADGIRKFQFTSS